MATGPATNCKLSVALSHVCQLLLRWYRLFGQLVGKFKVDLAAPHIAAKRPPRCIIFSTDLVVVLVATQSWSLPTER